MYVRLITEQEFLKKKNKLSFIIFDLKKAARKAAFFIYRNFLQYAILSFL
jgi:hypothetical protein